MTVPPRPKLYHIVHIDRLASIVSDGQLMCDARMSQRQEVGTMIGMRSIKQRRLGLPISCHSGLRVGDCVPFYFCHRSVMLYLIHRGNNPELSYQDGQGPIAHLEFDMHEAIAWAEQNRRRWAFTLSNAGAYYFEDRCDIGQLGEINWEAVRANQWAGNGVPASLKEGKQAEFLVEKSVPWELVNRVGVINRTMAQRVSAALPESGHRPTVEIMQSWYY